MPSFLTSIAFALNNAGIKFSDHFYYNHLDIILSIKQMFKMISKSMFSVSVDIIFHTVATFSPLLFWNRAGILRSPIKQPCPCLTLQIILRLLSGGVA